MYGMYGYDPRMADPSQGRGRQERDTAPVRFTEGKLFIGGVEASLISREELVEYCSQWGEVADAVVMDRKGYGFVTFADPKNAMDFLEKRVHELKGRRLDAKASVPKAHLGTAKLTKKMFVGGTGELTDTDFREHFSQYGEIEDAAVVRREGLSRGFGFVTFKDEISVEKCLLVSHFIKGRKVELKRAVPKDEVMGGQGVPVLGYPPAGPYGPHPGMMQQQFYHMPYGPGPAPYGMRPGFPPGPAGMHMPADPYGWYGMGYMPAYFPPAGMYPPPYGMMPPQPQPGMHPPYGAMPPGPYMAAGPGGVPGGMPAGMRSHPQQQQYSGQEAGSSRGGSSREGGTEAAAGSSSHQQQRQHEEAHAASPAGPSSSGGGGLPPGVGGGNGARRAASDPALAGSGRAGSGGSSGGGGSSSQGPPGIHAASGSSSPGAAARSAHGGPMMAAFPGAGMRPAAAASPQRAMGPGMQYAAAGVPPHGAGFVGVLPAGGVLAGGFVGPHRTPVVATAGPQATGNRRPQQQAQEQQPPQ